MKKKLLFALMAVCFTMGAYATEVGSYIYTHTAKFKVVGENIVANGNFNVGDGSEGWKNDLGEAISASWKVVTNCGPNGENAIESQGASTAEGDMLVNKWQLAGGLYVISYYVYAAENTTCSVAAGNTNYVNLFANETGDNTITRGIAGAESWKGEQWTQIVDTIFVNADQEYLVFNANNVTEGVRFTGFELFPVSEVYDTRNLDRLVSYAEKLVQEPDLAVGKDEFEGIIGILKDALANPESIEDKEAAEALVGEFNNAFDEYLNQNGGNTKGTTGDWTTWTSTGFKGLTSRNAWVFDGGRWGFSANDATLGRPENDGYVASAGIQKGWEQNWGARIETADLKKGTKYFFSIEVQGIVASTTQISDNPPYGADYNTPLLGEENFKLFVGDTYLDLTGDTLSGYYWKRYYLIAEIPEDAETVKAGVTYHMPSTIGGRFSLRNPEFRLIGKTEVQINYEAALANAYLQQTETKKRLDTYAADVADYKWAKDSLIEIAIPLAQAVYEASFEFVAADGTSPLPVTEESVEALKTLANDLLENGVRRLNRAKDYVINQNAIFGSLQNAIDGAKDVLADDLYQDGDKATFQAAINYAQTTLDIIYASTTDATRETDEPELQAAIDELAAAVDAFKVSAHLTPVVDIDFANGFTAVEGEEDTYVVNGAAGVMEFGAGNVITDNTAGGTHYSMGVNGELEDVLRVGNSIATVALPAIGDGEAVRVCFDIWFGNLVGKYLYVKLLNAADEEVAGFGLNRYDAKAEYNHFNNEDNEGMDIVAYTSGIGSSSASNAAICVDENKSSFQLIIDYKAQAVKGIVSNPQKGTCTGAALPIPEVSDSKVVKFALSSNYNNSDRRCWFDNLKVYKYNSSAQPDGIESISENTVAKGAIYNLMGVQVTNAQKPGLYIQNGKKFMVK